MAERPTTCANFPPPAARPSEWYVTYPDGTFAFSNSESLIQSVIDRKGRDSGSSRTADRSQRCRSRAGTSTDRGLTDLAGFQSVRRRPAGEGPGSAVHRSPSDRTVDRRIAPTEQGVRRPDHGDARALPGGRRVRRSDARVERRGHRPPHGRNTRSLEARALALAMGWQRPASPIRRSPACLPRRSRWPRATSTPRRSLMRSARSCRRKTSRSSRTWRPCSAASCWVKTYALESCRSSVRA